uniref:AMP-dependent synthetase/ligase domain-containing protein n=2 Tax=Dendroctonus ponderosae TaxID=77166 RepID=A0AAR5Q9E2_DENPD
MSFQITKRFLVPSTKLKHYRTAQRRCLSVTCSRRNIRDNILFSPIEVQIPNVSLAEYVFGKTAPFADYTAFECPFTRRKYTFSQVRKLSRNLGKVLRKKLGFNKGDVALIYLANCPEFPIAALGCLEAGVIVSTANSLYTSGEILRQLKDSSAKLVITTCDLYERAAKAVSQLPGKIPIICIKTKPDQLLPQGTIDFSEIINLTLDIPDLDPPNADDIAILPYSSGTTGLPKGVELTHRNIVSNLCQISTAETDALELAHGDFQEISPGILPMFHIYGFTITTMNLMTKGAKVLPLPKFTPDSFIDVLQNYHCSIIFAAPPLVLFLTHYPDVKPEYLHHLRNVMSGAAPLGALDESKFLEKANRDVFISQGYGLTETSPVVSTVLKSVREKLGKASSGSVGHVLPNTEVKLVKLDDKTATPLGLGEQGEVLVKGPQVMKGYHNNPEATKNALHEGWFKTGDLAYYDANGMLFITDRVKELIKVRGYQVAPAELEELLRDHPSVEDAAVI